MRSRGAPRIADGAGDAGDRGARATNAMSDDGTIAVPRLVIAGAGSGVGKTTVVVALAAALRARGLAVATFKCGPDYLDPSYHARATGATSHNLDGWLMGRDAVLATFARAAAGVDVALVEGMMGLFDGAGPTSDVGSTAEVARWLEAPVLVCIDVSGMARTVAAVAGGLASFDPALRVAGVLGMGIGGEAHLAMLRAACPAPPVLGGLPRRPELAFPERHLGLVHAGREALADETLGAWAKIADGWLDLDAILAVARSAPRLTPRAEPATAARPGASAAPRARIGVARDEAFHFYYEDNLARLARAGAELVGFSPLTDARLPALDGVYLGGGYPEVHAAGLAANHAMLDALREFAARGGPIYGECGGYMYLVEAIRTLDGAQHPMLGILPGVAVMSDRLKALGYVEAQTIDDSILGAAGTRLRGHQFRYSELRAERDGGAADPPPEALYRIHRPGGGPSEPAGARRGSVLGSYVHAHWASSPAIPEAFVAACRAWRDTQRDG